jgi:hypothetical protein
MLVTQPYSPRLILRSPSTISRPMLRLLLAIWDLDSNPPQHTRKNILGYVLRQGHTQVKRICASLSGLATLPLLTF